MKRLLIAFACFALTLPCLAQNADQPASKDDIILYLRTMHTHDLMRRTMEVQGQAMEKMLHDTLLKQKGQLPPGFDAKLKKAMDDLIKGMPMDEIEQAMIPTYQKHFTHGDIEAMNTFYSSPVGQKVIQELPDVMREGTQAALPLLTKYITEWQERTKHLFDDAKTPEKNTDTPVQQ